MRKILFERKKCKNVSIVQYIHQSCDHILYPLDNNVDHHHNIHPRKMILIKIPNKIEERLTWGKAQQAYSSWFDLQQVWFDGQATSDDSHWFKISFSNEIVAFNWQVSCFSSQIYLNGQQIEPFEPQHTPFYLFHFLF